MLSRHSLTFAILASLSLMIGAMGTPTPSILPVRSTPTATGTAPTSSSTSTSNDTESTPKAVGKLFCPWCDNLIPAASKKTSCKVVVQMPEKSRQLFTYPVFVFNHSLTELVLTETVKVWEPFYHWDKSVLGFHVVFTPVMDPDSADKRYVVWLSRPLVPSS